VSLPHVSPGKLTLGIFVPGSPGSASNQQGLLMGKSVIRCPGPCWYSDLDKVESSDILCS